MKFIRPIFYALVAIICLVLVYSVYMGNSAATFGAGFGMNMMFLLGAIAAGAAIFFPIRYMVSHPKNAVRALIGAVAILVIFGLGYALSGDEILITYEKVGFTSPTASKLVGGALIMMYLMILGVIGSALFSELRKFLK